MAGIGCFLEAITGSITSPGMSDDEAICRAACSQIKELDDMAAQIPAGYGTNAAAWSEVIKTCSMKQTTHPHPIITMFATMATEKDYRALCHSTALRHPVMLDYDQNFPWMTQETWCCRDVAWSVRVNGRMHLREVRSASQELIDTLIAYGVLDLTPGAATAEEALKAIKASAGSNIMSDNMTSYEKATAWALVLAPEAPGITDDEKILREIACHIMDKCNELATASMYSETFSAPDHPFQVIATAINNHNVIKFYADQHNTQLDAHQMSVLICTLLSMSEGIIPYRPATAAVKYAVSALETMIQMWQTDVAKESYRSKWTEWEKDVIPLLCDDLPPLTSDLYDQLVDTARSSSAWEYVEPYMGITNPANYNAVDPKKKATFMLWIGGIVKGTKMAQKSGAACGDFSVMVSNISKVVDLYIIDVIFRSDVPKVTNMTLDNKFMTKISQQLNDWEMTDAYLKVGVVAQMNLIMKPTRMLHSVLLSRRLALKMKYKDNQYIMWRLEKSQLVKTPSGIELLKTLIASPIMRSIVSVFYPEQMTNAIRAINELAGDNYNLSGMFQGLAAAPETNHMMYPHVLWVALEYQRKNGQFMDYNPGPKINNIMTLAEGAAWHVLISYICGANLQPLIDQIFSLRSTGPLAYAEALASNDPLGQITSAVKEVGLLQPAIINQGRREARELMNDYRRKKEEEEAARRREPQTVVFQFKD